MKYWVKRTGQYGDTKPCDEVVEEFYDRRVEMIKSSFRPDWLDKWKASGKNHREVTDADGRAFMVKDVKDKCWVVDLNSLEELNQFSLKYGDIIISNEDGQWKLEIYDDYRE